MKDRTKENMSEERRREEGSKKMGEEGVGGAG